MARHMIRPAIMSAVLALGGSGLAMTAAPATSASVHSGAGDCIAHRPTLSGEYQIGYTGGCSGHDEPELVLVFEHVAVLEVVGVVLHWRVSGGLLCLGQSLT